MRILGIDPGSRLMGYGIIEWHRQQARALFYDTLVVKEEGLSEKLALIFECISKAILDYQPEQVAVEQVFVQKNVQSALKLGQARGAAVAAVGVHRIPIFEYAPLTIKRSVVGFGRAEKTQVQYMVRILLNLQGQTIASDSADALAVALCHAYHGGVRE